MCNCAWLLLLHSTAVKSLDGLVQLFTQKYITSRQRGVHLHPPYPPKSATVDISFTFCVNFTIPCNRYLLSSLLDSCMSSCLFSCLFSDILEAFHTSVESVWIPFWFSVGSMVLQPSLLLLEGTLELSCNCL